MSKMLSKIPRRWAASRNNVRCAYVSCLLSDYGKSYSYCPSSATHPKSMMEDAGRNSCSWNAWWILLLISYILCRWCSLFLEKFFSWQSEQNLSANKCLQSSALEYSLWHDEWLSQLSLSHWEKAYATSCRSDRDSTLVGKLYHLYTDGFFWNFQEWVHISGKTIIPNTLQIPHRFGFIRNDKPTTFQQSHQVCLCHIMFREVR